MHHTISHHLAQDRIAGLRRHAQRASLARAARPRAASPARAHHTQLAGRLAAARRSSGRRPASSLAQSTTATSRQAMCTHEPRCPSAGHIERVAAHVIATHPEQGWSLLCNGIVLFDDGGLLLPGGRAEAPRTQPFCAVPA